MFRHQAANHLALNEIVANETKKEPTATWLSRLEAADIPHSNVNTYANLLDDPHFQAISAVSWINQTGAGRIPLAAIPAVPHANEGEAPAIGEHSREVLTTLGLPATEIEGLLAAGVVVGAAGSA